MKRFMVFCLFATPVFAQEVGYPGISYKGGLGEKDICLRPDSLKPACSGKLETDPKTATFFPSVFAEKLQFKNFCHSSYRAIELARLGPPGKPGAGVEPQIQQCGALSEKAASALAMAAEGAGAEAIGQAKKVAAEVKGLLETCVATLKARISDLERIDGAIGKRADAAIASVDRQIELLKAENSTCKPTDVLPAAQDMQDIATRYKKGLLAHAVQVKEKAEKAHDSYELVIQKLEGFISRNSSAGKGMKSLQ